MPQRPLFKFRLYIADNLLNSSQARQNLTALCRKNFEGRYEIEVVDIFQSPERARDDGVGLTPTLILLLPLPERRVVGTLGDAQETLQALDLRVESVE